MSRKLRTLLALLMGAALIPAASASAAVTQRPQPVKGPGGSQSVFGGVRVAARGKSYNAWELLEPADPAPPSAPLVVVMHGYYDYSGYAQLDALARHLAAKGNIVIYPRWQTGISTPCPGPFNDVPCITSAVTAIHSAIAFLHTHRRHVQPRLGEASYFGFSFGGILTINMINQYRTLHIPKPRAVFLDDPHDGGLTGANEPTVDPNLDGIPATTKLVCHTGADGVTSQPPYENASCNAVFPKLGRIPEANKSIVLTSNDSHGQPGLVALHGVCAGPGSGYSVDTFDWGFCWRSFDALRACALYNTDCEYALGDNPYNRYIGTWSDGTPVIGLKVQEAAPIRPNPVPPRQPATPPTPNAPPIATLGHIRDASAAAHTRLTLRGTARGDNGAQFVQVAVVRIRGRHCLQMTATGRFAPLRRCRRPTSFLWANGDTSWSLRLPTILGLGTYRIIARAIDSLGQTQNAYGRASSRTLTVR